MAELFLNKNPKSDVLFTVVEEGEEVAKVKFKDGAFVFEDAPMQAQFVYKVNFKEEPGVHVDVDGNAHPAD